LAGEAALGVVAARGQGDSQMALIIGISLIRSDHLCRVPGNSPRGATNLVKNGRAGLHQLEKAAFDLIVTDIIMPDVEGIEVLMTVRE
jgi:CheY-like chemotaxis protein